MHKIIKCVIIFNKNVEYTMLFPDGFRVKEEKNMLHRLLVLDETPKIEILFKEILEADGGEFEIKRASDKIDAELAVNEFNPELALVSLNSGKAVAALKSLQKKNICPPLVFMGNNLGVKPKELLKIKAVDEIELPFDPAEFCLKIDDDIYLGAGRVDELTGLFKKGWFDYKMEKLMKKKVKGTLFCMSLDAYSFAANPPTRLQLQMATYALKSGFKEGILAINGTMILGFFPSEGKRADNERYINGLIETMCAAADQPPIFICAGAAETDMYDFSAVDTYVYANKAMGLSLDAGKNCVRYYK